MEQVLPDGETTLDAAVKYGHLLAATTGPNAVAAKQQLHEDILRGDPAASVAESKGFSMQQWVPMSTEKALRHFLNVDRQSFKYTTKF